MKRADICVFLVHIRALLGGLTVEIEREIELRIRHDFVPCPINFHSGSRILQFYKRKIVQVFKNC
jgi:hypothetical protein